MSERGRTANPQRSRILCPVTSELARGALARILVLAFGEPFRESPSSRRRRTAPGIGV